MRSLPKKKEYSHRYVLNAGRSMRLKERKTWICSRVRNWASMAQVRKDKVAEQAVRWLKGLAEIDAANMEQKGAFADEIAPLKDSSKPHGVVAYLNKLIDIEEVRFGVLTGVKPINYFDPRDALVIANYWKLNAEYDQPSSSPQLQNKKAYATKPPPPRPTKKEFPYDFAKIMKHVDLMDEDFSDLKEILDTDMDLNFKPHNFPTMALKCKAVIVLFYLARKYLEHKEPHFTKPEIIAMLTDAGARAKFAQLCDAAIGLAFANPSRLDTFFKQEAVLDLDLNLSADKTSLKQQLEREVRRQPDAKKSTDAYKIFKQVYKSCNV